MKRFLTSLAVVGTALGLAAAANAQYFTHVETVLAPPGGVATSGLSSVTFTAGGNYDIFAGGDGTDVVLANLSVASTQLDGTPDTFTIPYTIQVDLWNGAPAIPFPPPAPDGSAIFKGTLTGTVSKGTSNLKNTYDPGTPSFYDIPLGGLFYHVQLGTYTAPEAPGGRLGAIGAHVSAVPEPGSFSLIGVGLLPLLGFVRRRK